LKLGLKVPTDCKKGDCGTCTVTVAGQKIRACVGKVPPAPRLKSLKEKGLVVTVDN
jgi:succinate dehydrogenase/fumarate reductase-like Fe-S protein